MSSASTPAVSVIVPAFGVTPYIAEALDSVRDIVQDHAAARQHRTEMIVVRAQIGLGSAVVAGN